ERASRRTSGRPERAIGFERRSAALVAGAPGTEQLLHRWLLARLAATFDPAACPVRLPPESAAIYGAHLERIVDEVEQRGDMSFAANDVGFQKELGILTFR